MMTETIFLSMREPRLVKSARDIRRPRGLKVSLGRGDIESLFSVDYLEPRTLTASISRRSGSASSPYISFDLDLARSPCRLEACPRRCVVVPRPPFESRGVPNFARIRAPPPGAARR